MRRAISPRSGVAFTLKAGETLRVIDPEGEQVGDLLAFSKQDIREAISSGRTFDYASRIYLTKGDPLYSNRSNVMLRIVDDTVGRHEPQRPHPGEFSSRDGRLPLYGRRRQRGRPRRSARSHNPRAA